MASFIIWLSLLVVSTTASSPPDRKNLEIVVRISNKLAADMHKKLSNEDENIFFSPVSISTALAMLFYGARGSTAEEMRRTLGYKNRGLTDNDIHSAFQSLMATLSEDSTAKQYKKYTLYLANALLTQKGYSILRSYESGLQGIYKAVSGEVDFRDKEGKAVQKINQWVKLKTNNQIDKMFDAIDANTVLILLNAVYFKGSWVRKFQHTIQGTFYNKGLESRRVTTEMMFVETTVPYARHGGAQFIELPYEGEDVTMVVLLPEARDGLSRIESELTPATLKNFRRLTKNTTMFVTFPKFKLEYKKTLNTVLQELGIRDIFERGADLSGISAVLPLLVSEIVHKAVIDVNEEGSEASGATGVLLIPYSGGLDNRFIANHPFLFAIVDTKSDLILFQGSVKNL